MRCAGWYATRSFTKSRTSVLAPPLFRAGLLDSPPFISIFALPIADGTRSRARSMRTNVVVRRIELDSKIVEIDRSRRPVATVRRRRTKTPRTAEKARLSFFSRFPPPCTYLRTNLVTTLAGLDVNDFPHVARNLAAVITQERKRDSLLVPAVSVTTYDYDRTDSTVRRFSA